MRAVAGAAQPRSPAPASEAELHLATTLRTESNAASTGHRSLPRVRRSADASLVTGKDAAEKSVDPKRDMPKGIMLGMFTLILVGFLRTVPQPVGDRRRIVQARHLGRAAARRLPRHLRRGLCAAPWRWSPSTGLVACFHAIIFAYGPADLFAVARRLFPAGAVDHARHAQDTAHRHGGRAPRRPCA